MHSKIGLLWVLWRYALSDRKNLMNQQRIKALQAPRAIHDRGILHNDI